MTGGVNVNWNADEIHLECGDLPRLPSSPDCSSLVKLFLQGSGLAVIPPMFFEHMPVLEVLDLSNTNIVSLPTSISSLSSLQELFLRDCSALIELPNEIGMLLKLKLFDIEGTELMFLPEGMGELKDLQVLRVSLSQYAKAYIKNSANETVIPRKMISKLQKLKELCVIISVGSEPEWWDEEVIYLQEELSNLENLQTLRWYLPTTEVVQKFLLLERNHVPIYENLFNLMLTIGQHAQLTSCLPQGLEKKLEKFNNLLKWINAEGSIDDISKIMARAEALFLSRHWTIETISNLGISNLKYFVLAECNEMETLVETNDLFEDVDTRIKNGRENALELLEYLSIHHMNKLQSVWKGPIGKDSLSKLRILALHTCSQLTSIFTPTIAENLSCLAELTVEDCPNVVNVISGESRNAKYGLIFPSLEKIFLLDLPELVYIFVGEVMLKKLKTMLVYSCKQLTGVSKMELPHIEMIEGETEWWKGFGYDKSQLNIIFVPLKEGRDLVEQLFDATNSLEHFWQEPKGELHGEYLESEIEDFSSGGEEHPFSLSRQDPLLSEFFTKLREVVVSVATTTAYFKPELGQLQETLQRIAPIINDVKLNEILDHQSDVFMFEIEATQKLVLQCLEIMRDLLMKFIHSLKLKYLNKKLLRFFQLEAQADQCRDIKQTLVEVHVVKLRMDSFSVDVKQINQTLSSSGSSLSRRDHLGFELIERGRLGWRVPMLPGCIVTFDEPLKKLKAKVLDEEDDDDDDSVVVVTAAGGCGKTTLVTMLCHDSEIQDKFGDNIFFVTVSYEPDFKAIVNDLFNPNPFGRPITFQSDEDAKNKLGNFLHENVSSPMLLVLDDVWSDSFIDNFPLNIKGCKILVTSRMAFSRYDVFLFDPLSDEDAQTLFSRSAFTLGKERPRPAIDGNLVNQMVKRCKKHPLTLTVVGSSLNGRDEPAWRSMLNTLSQGSSVLDLNEQVRNCLERSFKALDEEFKEYYMDFGLFPEDQRIPASALLDMWVHLYNHDHEGRDTFDKIVRLSFRNLINLVASGVRKDSGATINYCDQQFVTQHDLLRELAIHLSSKPDVPIAQRKRLIIAARGKDLPPSILNVQEQPMRACILSISTGEFFSSRWCNLNVPEGEVMVLNLKSKTYTLPPFMKEMQKLKILNVTNYGLYPSHIENFHLLGCLSNLSRIRLERVAISSLSTPVLALENLQKASFIMCKIGNAFEAKVGSSDNLKVWPRLVELEIDYCQDLEQFPRLLCDSLHLKTLSITNCNEMRDISYEFGKLTNLENLSLRSCTKLEKLPESITRLEKLSILDISDCLSMNELPAEMGKLVGLRTIYMKGCTGIYKLPSSVEELSNTHVVCNEEIYNQWLAFDNVEADLVEEDRLETLMKII